MLTNDHFHGFQLKEVTNTTFNKLILKTRPINYLLTLKTLMSDVGLGRQESYTAEKRVAEPTPSSAGAQIIK